MGLSDILDKLTGSAKKYLNRSFGLGVLIGIILTTTAFSGALYYQSLDHRVNVPITVVTCNSCEYGKFKNATDRMFEAKYREIDYQSEEGQEMIQKYNLKYVPAFVFDKNVEEAEAFNRTESSLVEFEDAYVIPDEGRKVAQRLSEGKYLNGGQG